MAPRRPRIQPVTRSAEHEASAEPVARRDFLARTAAAVGAGLLAFAGRPALPGGDQARAATTGAEPFIGEIMMFAGWFPPRGWADCNGQILPIAQYTALFSLLGTTFGGNGQTTFALPDLRGRVPMHLGQGPGLSSRTIGEMGGAEAVTLLETQLPAHTHVARADTGNGTLSSPVGALPARDPAGSPAYGAGSAGALSAAAIAPTGGSQPHSNVQPYTVIRYCICLEGIYPSQN